MPGVARGDELATVIFLFLIESPDPDLGVSNALQVWQQWPQSNDLDMLFCARGDR